MLLNASMFKVGKLITKNCMKKKTNTNLLSETHFLFPNLNLKHSNLIRMQEIRSLLLIYLQVVSWIHTQSLSQY